MSCIIELILPDSIYFFVYIVNSKNMAILFVYDF